MSVRELVVLGTASQVPTRHRNHNGYLLRWDGLGLLFDPGEGTQRQMIRAGVSASDITHILITHFHGDHCLGLAGIVQRISLDEVPHQVDILYPASGQRYYERLRHASIFLDRARTRACPLTEEGPLQREAGFTLFGRRLDHGVETWGYRLEEPAGRTLLPERLKALGLRGPAIGRLQREGRIEHHGRIVTIEEVSVERPGQSVAFVMDTRPCDGALALARGVDLLICESTYLETEVKEAHERGHMTARQAATLARDAGARKLVLTHFSQRYPDERAFLDEAAPIFPEVVAVRDGMRVPLPPRRTARSGSASG